MTAAQPDDTALITFATGSTGTPKAANRTHRFLQAQYDALHPLLDTDCTVTLTLLPVVVLLNRCLGKTNILPKGKIQPGNSKVVIQLLQIMQHFRAESLIASPAITVALAKVQIQFGIQNYVHQVITGGGPLFPEGAASIISVFPDAEAMVVYGSTEAEPISILSMQSLACTPNTLMRQKGLPVGIIHYDISAAIVPFTEAILPDMDTETFEQLQQPAGTSGELLVSGPYVLQQYLNNGAAQRHNKFWVNGHLWHRTGDEATTDENNNLYFLGRYKEAISLQGKKLYPILFTWLLRQQVPVREAALLQVDSKLVVVLQKTDVIHSKAVNDYLQKTLPEAQIVWVKSIPKDKRHHTKTDYEQLRHLLQ